MDEKIILTVMPTQRGDMIVISDNDGQPLKPLSNRMSFIEVKRMDLMYLPSKKANDPLFEVTVKFKVLGSMMDDVALGMLGGSSSWLFDANSHSDK